MLQKIYFVWYLTAFKSGDNGPVNARLISGPLRAYTCILLNLALPYNRSGPCFEQAMVRPENASINREIVLSGFF